MNVAINMRSIVRIFSVITINSFFFFRYRNAIPWGKFLVVSSRENLSSIERELIKLLDFKQISFFLKHLLHRKWYIFFETPCIILFSFIFYMKVNHYYYLMFFAPVLRVVFFTEVQVTASLVRSPGLYSVFLLIITVLVIWMVSILPLSPVPPVTSPYLWGPSQEH